jgi:hypothetical protein
MNTAARKGFKSFASNFGFNKIYKAISRQRIATLLTRGWSLAAALAFLEDKKND